MCVLGERGLPPPPTHSTPELASRSGFSEAVDENRVGPTTGWSVPKTAFLIYVIFVINSNKNWRENAFLEEKITFSSTCTINARKI